MSVWLVSLSVAFSWYSAECVAGEDLRVTTRATYHESVHPERNVLASASSAFEVMNAGYTSPEVASVGMLGNDEVRREH